MNLRDGVLAVRQAIGEIVANFWSDQEIVDHLNVSARRMCSEAQCLQSEYVFNAAQVVMPDGTSQYAQEYALPIDVDQVIQASYYLGSVFPLRVVQQGQVQVGTRISGLPIVMYMRTNARQLTHHTATGIQVQPFPPNDGGNPRTVIGLYPVPNSAIPIYIGFLQWHPMLRNAFDEVFIPDRFKQGWVGYAIARCKEKESALQEAQYWDGIHQAIKQEFIDYMTTQGQEMTPPTFSNRPASPGFLGGNNVIIVTDQHVT